MSSGPESDATRGGLVLLGSVWHALERFVPQFYSLAISIVAAHYLGPAGMGRQSYIAFVALSVTALLSSSMWTSLVRHIGETIGRGDTGMVRGLLNWAWRIEGATAIVGAAAIVGVAVAGAEPEGAWLLAAAITASAILHTVPSAILTGLQRFRQASVVGITTGLAGTVATVFVLSAGGGIVGMFAVELVAGLVNLAWTSAIARRVLVEVAPVPLPPGPLRRQVTRYALGYSAGIVLELVVARRSELFFLDRFSSDHQIAFYSIAFSVVAAASQIPQALAGATAPAFANLFGSGSSERIRSGFNRALRLLFVFALPVTAAGIALGPTLVQAVYGNRYGAVTGPLVILLVGYPLLGATSLANAALTGLGRLRVPVLANMAAAIVDIGAAAALTGPLGARGAALANLGGQLVYSGTVLVYTLRIVGYERPDFAVVRAAAAAAAAGAAAWAVQSMGPPVVGVVAGAGAFVVSFAVLAWALRIIPRGDAAWLDDALGSKLPRPLRRAVQLCARNTSS